MKGLLTLIAGSMLLKKGIKASLEGKNPLERNSLSLQETTYKKTKPSFYLRQIVRQPPQEKFQD